MRHTVPSAAASGPVLAGSPLSPATLVGVYDTPANQKLCLVVRSGADSALLTDDLRAKLAPLVTAFTAGRGYEALFPSELKIGAGARTVITTRGGVVIRKKAILESTPDCTYSPALRVPAVNTAPDLKRS